MADDDDWMNADVTIQVPKGPEVSGIWFARVLLSLIRFLFAALRFLFLLRCLFRHLSPGRPPRLQARPVAAAQLPNIEP